MWIETTAMVSGIDFKVLRTLFCGKSGSPKDANVKPKAKSVQLEYTTLNRKRVTISKIHAPYLQ